MDPLTALRLEFNRYLLDAIGGEILGHTAFAWSAGGFTSWLLGLCLAIAFFQSVLRNGTDLLVEWVKIVIAAWFCLAILGGVDYRRVPVLSRLDAVPQEYAPKGGSRPTLERAAFNYLAWKFDQMGEAIINDVGGNEALSKEIVNLATLQDKLLLANLNCKTSDAACYKHWLTGSVDEKKLEQENKEKEAESGGLLSSLNPAAYLSKVVEFFQKLSNPAYLFFPLMIWILNIIRAFVNFFVLLAFGIIAAMSLFMLKVLCPVMVIPSYRGRVIAMFKIAASAALYGFAMNLILWISIVITRALNTATANIIISRLTSSSQILAIPEIGALMISNFLVAFVIMVMQIVAIARVPKICRQLMDLSLDEIVNIGGTLMQAGMGIATMAGRLGMAVATGGAGLAIGAGAGLLAGKTSGQLGTSLTNRFRSLVGGAPRDGTRPSDVGGAGLARGTGGGGGSGGGLGGGGGSSLPATALGESRLQTTPKPVLKRPSRQRRKQIAGTEEDGSTEGGAAARPDLVDEQEIKRGDQAVAAASMLWSGAKTAGGLLGSLAMDGMNAGMGMGDGLGTVNFMGRTLVRNADEISESIATGANKLGQSARSLLPNSQKFSQERAGFAEKIYRSTAIDGKQALSAEKQQAFTESLNKIGAGTYENSDVLAVMQASNTAQLSAAEQSSIAELRKNSTTFDNAWKKEEAVNQKLIEKIEKEFSSKGDISTASLRTLGERHAAGMIDYDAINNSMVLPKGSPTGTTLGRAMNDTANREMAAVVDPLLKKLDEGKQLSMSEQQVADRTFLQQQSRLVGDQANLAKFDRLYGGSKEEVSMLKQFASRDQAAATTRELSNKIEASSEIIMKYNEQMHLSRQVNSDGSMGFDGVIIGNNSFVMENSDLTKLPQVDRERVETLYKELDLLFKDNETRQMSKVAETQLKPVKDLYDFLRKALKKG